MQNLANLAYLLSTCHAQCNAQFLIYYYEYIAEVLLKEPKMTVLSKMQILSNFDLEFDTTS